MTEERRDRLAARARRITRIRRGAVAATLSAFALAWGVIATTGSMGADATTTVSTPATSDWTASTQDSTASSDDPTTSSDDAVTTAQS